MKELQKYRGVVVPMVTAFNKDGSIDTMAVAGVAAHIVAGGASGVFVLGTTGEGPSIPFAARKEVVRAAKSAMAGSALLYAGISGNCLGDCLTEAEAYAGLGADVFVACAPYYYPVPDEWIEQWFRTLADRLDRPLMIYNIPVTTGVSISVDVIEKLSSHSNIAGLKDSQNDAGRFEEILSRLGGRDDFVIQVGTMAQALHGLRLGADGLVPSSGNVIPEVYVEIFEAAKQGDWDAAQAANDKAAAFSTRYQAGRTLGESLASLKRLMADDGLCKPHVLAPFCENIS